jgi:hypothetical protein
MSTPSTNLDGTSSIVRETRAIVDCVDRDDGSVGEDVGKVD